MNRALLCVLFVVACIPPQTNGGPRTDVKDSTQHGGQSTSELQGEEQLVRRLKRLLHICSAIDDVHTQLDNVTDKKLFSVYRGSVNEDRKRGQDDGLETEVNVLLTQKGRLDSNLVAELVKQFDSEGQSAVKLTPASTSILDERQADGDTSDKNHPIHDGHKAHSEQHFSQHRYQHSGIDAAKRGEESANQMMLQILKNLEQYQYGQEYGKRSNVRTVRETKAGNDATSAKSEAENEALLGHLHKAAALVDEADDLLVKSCSHLHLAVYLASKP